MKNHLKNLSALTISVAGALRRRRKTVKVG